MKKQAISMMTGTVVNDKMDKTIIVRVTSTTSHPIYKRVQKRVKKYKVHDVNNIAKVGDRVKIAMTRPISRTKRWRLVEVLR